ncbi:MAG: tRNA (N6-isopentenyl adenosine(37)-C2)-methylthiotransferase MiaB [Spirochaetaceae bacterium]|nr:MAG: tRNA (N6-isopentenyl adenosine(37)-C2)-methylthiotransferase MiaB [Spirochaetaceae bacterium]
MYYHLVPLGCQMNQSDAERIRTVLEDMGYRPCEREEDADLLGVVACSVRQKSIDKVYSKIHKWNSWKNSRALITFASGCILPADREKLLKRFDLLFTINELPQVPDMIRQYGVVTASPSRDMTGDIREGFWKVEPTYTSPIEAYVPIQNGCDKFCTFCAVPYTRGREVSRPSGEILREIESLLRKGYRTVTLLGQNVNSYGLDRRSSEIRFSALLREIGELTRGEEIWVYFTSPHPRDMGEDVLEAIAEYPTLAKQIHLPIQSGDDKILIRMNRNYRVSGYRRVVESIRTILPGATLFTDIIVGFTGEREEQFLNTAAAMEEFRYNMAYIAQYSPRPGAASARWADDIPQETKRERLHRLTEILERTGLDYNRALLGREVTVLVDGYDRKGYLSGKTEGRIPVRIAGAAAPGDDLIGSFVDVRVEEVRPLSIAGRIVAEAFPRLRASSE